MGLDLEECWFRSSSCNWFGHQSLFEVPVGMAAPWLNGHFASVDMGFFSLGRLIGEEVGMHAALEPQARHHRVGGLDQ
jgi:hypothetical protein